MSTSLEIQTRNSTTSLSSNETPSDDFVLVSPSNSLQQFSSNGSKPCQASIEGNSSKKFAGESHREDEIIQKVVELGHENDQLKDALQKNNVVLQQYIKDFSEMQESHKVNNEYVKREHQRAKEVVRKLRDDNRALKEELKKANSRSGQEVKNENDLDLERENDLMKEQIKSFQVHVENLDEYMKDCEIPENVADNWQQLLGSLVSYNYKAGMPQRNEKPLAEEMVTEGECSSVKPRENFEQKYMELETEKEILKVDEKIKVERDSLEKHVAKLQEEYNKLKTTYEQVQNEKNEIKKTLREQCKRTSNVEKELHEKALMCQALQEEVQKCNDELHNTLDKLRYAEENASLMKCEKLELEQQLKKQSESEVEEDGDIHKLCREKYKTMEELYFRLERKMNNMEDRENSLCAKEKAFEIEKAEIQKKDDEMKNHYVAELETHSKNFVEKINELHSELKEAREREEYLQEQLEEQQEKEDSLKEQVCQLIPENDAMRIKIEKLTELNSRRDKLYEDRMKAIENKKKEKEKEHSSFIERLQNQLGAAEEERKKFQDQSRVFKAEHDRLAYQHEQITKEYDELLNSYKSLLQDNRIIDLSADIVQQPQPQQHSRSHHSSEIETYRDQMDDYATHLAAAQEESMKKGSIISDLQNRLRIMEEQQTEEIPVLKQQMDVYFNDFKAEREARERQNEDLLNLREENERLAQANRELQHEVENLQNHHQMAEMQRRHLSHSGQFNPEGFRSGFQSRRGGAEPIYDVPASARPPQERSASRRQEPRHELEEPINCPGCDREFWSFAECENHFNQCQGMAQRNQPQVNNQCPICGNEYPDQDTLEIHVQECLRDAQ